MEQLAEISLAGFETADHARKTAIASQIDTALKSLGFFVISEHGVPNALIDDTVGTATSFFDLPAEEKRQIRSTVQGSPRGFIDFGEETLGLTSGQKTPPDLKEGFGMGPVRVETGRAVLDGVAATYTGPLNC